MNFQGTNLNQMGTDCGCGNNTCPYTQPTYQQCQQVVQTCNVQEVPHYVNYHTHVVNNCVKRHVNIPTYSTSGENVIINEYVQGQPMFQQPNMYQGYPYPMTQYQGNVGVEGIQFPNLNGQGNPFNY